MIRLTSNDVKVGQKIVWVYTDKEQYRATITKVQPTMISSYHGRKLEYSNVNTFYVDWATDEEGFAKGPHSPQSLTWFLVEEKISILKKCIGCNKEYNISNNICWWCGYENSSH